MGCPHGHPIYNLTQYLLTCSFRSRVFPGRSSRKNVHDRDQDHKACQKGQEHVLGEACHDVGQRGDRRAGHRVRDLRGHVVQVVALRAGRRHDRRIGDR